MRFRVALALAALFTLAAGAQPAPAVIVIDASQIMAEVSPLLFGANFGPLNTVPVDLIEEARTSGVNYLRFPGGRVGDLGDMTTSQIDMYMTTCRMLDCTPAISARLEGGTPEKAAEMVRYVNITKGYDVRYWSIGNEANLYDNYTAERAAAEWRTIAEAMLAVDPNIILIGPDTSQFTGIEGDSNGRAHAFLREFLRQNGDMVDLVGVHRYPFGTQQATVAGLQADASTWSGLIDNLQAIVVEQTGREIPIGITEFNSDWSPARGQEATPDSYANALWVADVLGQMINGVEIGVYHAFQSSDRLGGYGLLGRYEVRPTYYAYQLYKQFGTQIVSAAHEGDVRAYAALREDGALTVMLINWSDTESGVVLDIGGFTAADSDIEITTLDPTTAEPARRSAAFSPDTPLVLTPQSINLVIIPARNE